MRAGPSSALRSFAALALAGSIAGAGVSPSHLPRSVHVAVTRHRSIPSVARVPQSSHSTAAPVRASLSPPSAEQVWLDSAATRCIEFHESTMGKLSPNLFQFEWGTFEALTGLSGDPGSYPVAVQDAAAFKLWQERSWTPWSTRFVCGLG